MKNWKNILFKVLSVAIVTMVVVPTWAASDGCDNDDNNMITPELALCSTHIYNVGEIENPSDAGKRAFMQEIIAMKTTLITQQMYKQFDQMESMLNRLKTQLEKAVLTNDLKVASGNADDDDGDAGSSGGGKPLSGTFVVGAQDCQNMYNNNDALQCYERNLGVVQQQSANGENPTTDLKKQAIKDWGELQSLVTKAQCCGGGGAAEAESCKYKSGTKPKDLKARDFKTLLSDMRNCLRKSYTEHNNEQLRLKSGVKN